ncbi:hypothetical protein JVU11DRAFT_1648 [Chiua virens]|nr:hypothetical protein JVU11DRAFT_1648 [Chiua virens]
MALSFRTARKLWMGFIALLSLICMFLAVVLWIHGHKSSNFGALIAIPCFAFVGAVWTILRKTFFSPQPVCVEVTWVLALLPFQIVLGLFASEADNPRHSHFTDVYLEVLVTLIWINAALVFLYMTGIILLASLTQLSYDQEVWVRDIDSSPCPFPFPVLFVYAFPFTAAYFRGAVVDLREGASTAATRYCLPGCPCHTKSTEASDSGPESANSVEGAPSSIPIRVPTTMERRNAIYVTLGQ